ncbi:MAG: DUF3990 domain-containing protein [Candidatus Riflebacteria bacterium]|nr:DUF3990 domain-containing protein [Candidatus Riflebacteria bacterium]
MILYHGSNIEVKEPKILVSDRKLDFGTGFYLTSSYEQAERWANLTKMRRNEGKSIVSVFEYDESNQSDLKVLSFKKSDKNWLFYVTNNRINPNASDDFDLVIGPVANDRTYPVIALYFSGIYDMEETIKRLLPQKLKDQYAFKTVKALNYLKFKEVIIK